MKTGIKRCFGGLALLFALGVIVSLPAFLAYVRDVHPRNVTRMLAQWEDEYRNRPSWNGDAPDRNMLEYVKNHYRYEDMPEYRDTEVAKELARQRRATLDAIEAWLDRKR